MNKHPPWRFSLSALIVNAQETVDEASNATMRVAALNIRKSCGLFTFSQIGTVHVSLGTPNHEKAAKWALSQPRCGTSPIGNTP